MGLSIYVFYLVGLRNLCESLCCQVFLKALKWFKAFYGENIVEGARSPEA